MTPFTSREIVVGSQLNTLTILEDRVSSLTVDPPNLSTYHCRARSKLAQRSMKVALHDIRSVPGRNYPRAEVLKSMSEVFRLKRAAVFLVQVSNGTTDVRPIARCAMLFINKCCNRDEGQGWVVKTAVQLLMFD